MQHTSQINIMKLFIFKIGNHFYTQTSNGYDGLVEIPVKQLNQCFTQCLFLDQCTVVSFDENEMRCFIQTNSEINETVYPQRAKSYKNERDTPDSGSFRFCF